MLALLFFVYGGIIMDPRYNYPYGNYMPYQRPMYNDTPTKNGINWVMGITEAKAYPLAPGSTALLMDSEQQRFYIKTTDQSGMATLKSYSFQEVTETVPAATQPQIDMSQYVTKEELTQMLKNLSQNKPLI